MIWQFWEPISYSNIARSKDMAQFQKSSFVERDQIFSRLVTERVEAKNSSSLKNHYGISGEKQKKSRTVFSYSYTMQTIILMATNKSQRSRWYTI